MKRETIILTIIIAVLCLVILSGLGYAILKSSTIDAYSKGIDQGRYDILYQINVGNQIPVVQNNQTNWITPGQYCGYVFGGNN